MNSKLKSILDSYNDFELASLSYYKLSTYMPETRADIIEYLQSKGLTNQKIETLITENECKVYNDQDQRCPRCKSNKLHSEQVEWTQTAFKAGYSDEIAVIDGLNGKATYKKRIICEVCGYYLTDPNYDQPINKDNFLKRIYNFIADILTA